MPMEWAALDLRALGSAAERPNFSATAVLSASNFYQVYQRTTGTSYASYPVYPGVLVLPCMYDTCAES